jgi:hypothetical protein
MEMWRRGNVNCQWWFVLCSFVKPIDVLAGVRRQRLALFIRSTKYIPPEDGGRIQSPKRHVLIKRQDDG